MKCTKLHCYHVVNSSDKKPTVWGLRYRETSTFNVSFLSTPKSRLCQSGGCPFVPGGEGPPRITLQRTGRP